MEQTNSRYTHGHHDSVLRSHRWRTATNSAAFLLPHLQEGMRILDVGSGPGTITADLIAITGRGTALEQTDEALALTAAELERRGIAAELRVGDVHALPFDDDSFDVVHAHQVLQHVADPVQALKEMARVTRPGGLVAARDSDYAAFTWWPPTAEFDEWMALYQRVARSNGGEPDAGRRLLAWAHQAGLADVTASADTWCFATPEDRQYWGGMWAERILASAMAAQAVADGHTTAERLKAISAAWLRWVELEDGWFVILHGEVLARV